MTPFRAPTFRRFVAGALALVNIAAPVAASASQYMQMMPVRDLVVDNGAPLAQVKVDTANTSTTSVRAGNALLKVAPASVVFGTVNAGKKAAFQTVTLTNLGSGAAALGLLSVGKQFSVTNNCDGVILTSLATCQVNISFTPTQVSQGVLDFVRIPFSSGTSSAEAFIELKGVAARPLTGVEDAGVTGFSEGDPALSLSVDGLPQIAYPLAIINQQSWTKSFTLASTGDAPLTFSGLSFTGNDGSFSANSNCPAQVGAGQSCTINVTFAPSIKGAKVATLNVGTSSFTGNVMPVNLAGEAIEIYPVYGASSTAALSFGSLVQGAADVTRSAIIFNTGTAAMNIANLALSGTNTTGLSIVNPSACAAPIAVGSSCTVQVALSAAVASATPFSANLVVTHDGRLTPVSPVNIPLNGSVVAQTRVLNFGSSLDFGAVDINVAKTRTLSVSNTGNSPVTGVSASTASPFSLSTNGCTGVTLLPASANSCTLTFSLTSATVAPVSGTATLSATNLTTAPSTVALSAAMQTRTLATITPATLAFGLSPSHLWSAEQLVTVTNTSTVRTVPTVAGRDMSATASANTIAGSTWVRIGTDTCSAGVEPGQTCTLGVQVQPPTSIAYNATITVYPDAGFTSNAKTFAVSSTGTLQSYTASLSSLAFGTVGSLQTKDVTVTFTNTSQTGTVVTGPSYTTPVTTPVGAGTFTLVANTCASGIPSLGTCAMTWRLTASSYPSNTPLAVSASFNQYFTGARTSTTVYPVTASLVGSNITVTPPADMDFGNVPAGQLTASAPRKLTTVTNTGAYPVTFNTVSSTPNTLSLSRDTGVANSCANSAQLLSGASCTVAMYPNVLYYTGATGPLSATVNISAYGVNGSLVTVGAPLAFTGTILAPTVSASVSSIDFGTVGERTSNPRSFTYQSTHGGNLQVYTTAVTGTGYSVSLSPSTCQAGNWQVEGTVCTATVTFVPGTYTTPTMAGTFKVTAVSSSVGREVLSIPLTAQVQAATFTVPFNDLAFGDVATQTASGLRYAVVKNTSALASVPVTAALSSVPASFTRYSGAATYSYEGETLSNCYYVKSTLAAGESCFVALSLSGATGTNGGLGTVSVAGTMAGGVCTSRATPGPRATSS
jgi:hypothetical protein